MQPSDNLVDGTVYLVIDSYPSAGPEQHISGEEALIAADSPGDYAFMPQLIIGAYAGDIQYVDNWYMVSLEGHISQARLSSVAAAVQCGRQNSEVWPDRIYVHKGEAPIHHDLLDLDDRTYLEINSSSICARVEERYGGRPPMSWGYPRLVDILTRWALAWQERMHSWVPGGRVTPRSSVLKLRVW